MAEIFGVTSGAVGIASIALKTTSALINFTNNISDAPKLISDLRAQLQMLRVILVEVDNTLLVRKGNAGKIDPARNALESCNEVLEGISNTLKPLQTDTKDGPIQIADAAINSSNGQSDQSIEDFSAADLGKMQSLWKPIIEMRKTQG